MSRRRRGLMSEQFKYELAKDLGFYDTVMREGWEGIRTKDAGNLVKRAIQIAEGKLAREYNQQQPLQQQQQQLGRQTYQQGYQTAGPQPYIPGYAGRPAAPQPYANAWNNGYAMYPIQRPQPQALYGYSGANGFAPMYPGAYPGFAPQTASQAGAALPYFQ